MSSNKWFLFLPFLIASQGHCGSRKEYSLLVVQVGWQPAYKGVLACSLRKIWSPSDLKMAKEP
ncbi:hypothetical protein HanIR_Chr09g0399441 [Helianthus annuus]|nr:hypothetical protein HanIR_Chr09g0399441 [Helianthus annuus]